MLELVDIVDTDTGEIYEEDMLVACAYIWAAKKGWKVVKDEIDTLELVYEDGEEWGPKTVRWIYVKDPRHLLQRQVSSLNRRDTSMSPTVTLTQKLHHRMKKSAV